MSSLNRRVWQADLLLLLTALIWGTGFVAQRLGMDAIGPMLFNALRFALGALLLVPFLLRTGFCREIASGIRGGMAAGVVLFCGAAFQQVGIIFTSVANAGFITGLYVLFVPMIGLALGHRTPRGTWAGATLAVAGLYLLSVTEGFTVAFGDLLQLAGALFWATHVLVLAHYTQRVNPLYLAFVQFVVCSLISLVAALFTEEISLTAIGEAGGAVLYSGLVAVGVGYTLQVVGQKKAPPAHAAILLSLEAVFAALAGWWILGETLSPRAMLGCTLMLGGMLVAQLAPLYGRQPSAQTRFTEPGKVGSEET
ncbi:MAG: DMT family transporter [Gammaproteobacteria bacterium]